MKDRTLTRAQRRMPLMHQPLLSDREVALLLAAAREAAAVRAQSERGTSPKGKESHHG